jgi:signal transduction histidine kinase
MPEQPTVLPHKDAKILIVDDKLANVEVLELLLGEVGYENLITTTRSTEVINLYQQHQPDLLLLDLLMPEMNGLDLLEQLQTVIAAGDYVPRVILTAEQSDDAKRQALQRGAHDFIRKPFDTTEVLLRIDNLLETRRLHQAQRHYNARLEADVRARTREIELYKVQLEQANRMKSNFIATISHELRTPLTAINGFSELLLSDSVGQLSDEQKRYLNDVYNSGKRLSQLVETILELADIRVNDVDLALGIVDVTEAAIAVASVLDEPRQKRHLTLSWHIAEPIEPILADSTKVKQMFYNYLDNAIKFSPEGAEVHIVLEQTPAEVVVTVRDEGIGIPSQHHEHVFEAFWQLDGSLTRRYEGIGIGLHLTKQLAELHGGRVWFSSAADQGSSFTFALPRTPPL